MVGRSDQDDPVRLVHDGKAHPMAFCTQCGHSNSDDARFCSNCGAALRPTDRGALAGGDLDDHDQPRSRTCRPGRQVRGAHHRRPGRRRRAAARLGPAGRPARARTPAAGSCSTPTRPRPAGTRRATSSSTTSPCPAGTRSSSVPTTGFTVRDVGSPQRHLRQPRADRRGGPRRRRRGPDRQVPAGLLPERAARVPRRERHGAMTAEASRSLMSIGEVLSQLRPEFPDVTISKIRFLESEGLVEPARTPSGYRKFSHDDVERLRYVLVGAARPLPAAAGDQGAPRRDRPRPRAAGRARRAAAGARRRGPAGRAARTARARRARAAPSCGCPATELVEAAGIDDAQLGRARGATASSRRSARRPARRRTTTATRW